MDSGVIEIKAKAKAPLEELKAELLKLGKGKIASTSNVIYYLLEEKVGPKGEPLAYTIVEFTPEGIIIRHTLSDEPAYLRKWEVLKQVFPLLVLATKYYEIDLSSIMELVDSLITELRGIVKNDVKVVERENAKLRIKMKRLEERIRQCNEERKALLEKLYLREKEIEELKAKLKRYETMSDSVLKEKIMEWVRDNNGSFDVAQFSKFYGVPENRVEQAVYDLIKEGYLKPL